MSDIKLDYEAIGKILKSNEVMNICNEYATKYVQSNQHIKSFKGFDRCHALIYFNTRKNPK